MSEAKKPSSHRVLNSHEPIYARRQQAVDHAAIYGGDRHLHGAKQRGERGACLKLADAHDRRRGAWSRDTQSTLAENAETFRSLSAALRCSRRRPRRRAPRRSTSSVTSTRRTSWKRCETRLNLDRPFTHFTRAQQWRENFKALEELVAPLAGEREVNSVLLGAFSDG